MRILIADQNALLLAAITATFGEHCEVVTATRRDVCLEHAQRQEFDLVIAGDKLVDYTGLELLSEIGGLFPETLLIFAASPARLKRLGSRLQLFGLLETISYPLTPRKLLETLQRARRSLPPKAARPVVRHVVLESEWDTGERLGLIEQELENPATESVTHEGWVTQDEGLVHGAIDANTGPSRISAQIGFETEAALDDFVFAPPPPAPPAVSEDCTVAIELTPSEVPVARAADVEPISNDPIFDQPELPPEPRWAEDGAANDMAYEPTTSSGGQSAPSRQPSAGPSDTSARKAADVAPRSGDKRPKVRTPTQPTAGQIEAFQRALARRKAEQSGQVGPADRGSANTGRATPPDGASWKAAGSKSLSELARMAASKRPLPAPQHHGSGAPPKRAVFMVGSGIAAALIAGVLFFELLRTPSGATEHLARAPVAQAPFARAPFASNSSTLITNNTGPVEAPVFTPPPPASAAPQAPPEQMDEAGPPVVNIPPEQTSLDPDGIPEPPPPPALERPGPMEPPSESSMDIVRGPPAGMVPPGFEPEPDGQ